MALINCIECGKEISSLAASCPNCGCPHEYQQANNDVRIHEVDVVWSSAVDLVLGGGGKLEAMTIIRNATGISIQEAHTIIEYISEHKKLPDNLPKTESERAKEKQLQKQPKPATCKSCHKQISTHTEVCPHCGNQTGVHVCPKCNSTNTETISGASKASSLMLFGVFAANKVVSKYRCRDCNHKF